jgi:RHS repeat-associated protein
MLGPISRTTTTHSPRGRPSCVAHPGDKRVSYAYDAVGRRSWMIEPDGGRFTYTHGAAGRLAFLLNPQGQRTSFTVDALGRETRKELANGCVTTQVYDSAGRLTGVTNRKSTGDTISGFAYAYDKAGNRIGVVQANGDRTTWAYDKTYQLTHEHRNGHFAFNVTYTYDPAGNRLVQEDSGLRTTYTYDAANQILTEQGATSTTTYTHDLAGNRTQKEAPEGTTYYTWDEDNRLTVAQPPAGAITMTYSAVGARVKKETATETKSFLYDFNNLLAELDDAGATDKLYTQTVEQYGDLVSDHHVDHTDYYAYDALGSTDALLEDTEYLLARHAYRAFGLDQSGADPNDAFAFVGRQGYFRDPEIDLYYVRARYYDPAAGKWISKDRIGYYSGQPNLYAYVANRPLTVTDPNGLAATEGWRRFLKSGPRLLSPGYDFKVNFVVPKPAPRNPQFWQVNFSATTLIVEDPNSSLHCSLVTESRIVMDVRNIGADEELIGDHQRTVPTKRAGTVCLMISASVHVVGFGGPIHLPPMSGHIPIDPSDAARLISQMRAPVELFLEQYGFLKKENCKCCKKILEILGIPDFEFLYIGGIGSWPK